MEATVFNPIQIHLLKMFERKKSVEDLQEVQDVLGKYYAQKMKDHLNKLWDEGVLDQKRLAEINEMDLHEWMRKSE